MLTYFAAAGTDPVMFLACIFLALVPSLVWLFIFGSRHKHKKIHVLFTFVAGMMAAALLLMYQGYWGDRLDLVFFSFEAQNFRANIESTFGMTLLSSFLVFMSVGFLEEFSKHWLTKKTDHSIFESIDDVIEYSIVAALGFAFLENIAYFFKAVIEGGNEQLFATFFVRSLFVVFIHVLCSGIYGYYYGVGFFATPVLHDLEKEGAHKLIPDVFHKIFHMKKETVYADEMASLGLIISMTLHGVYNFVMHNGFVVFNVSVHVVLLPAILIFGFLYLSYLLDKKEDQKRFGHIEARYIPSEGLT